MDQSVNALSEQEIFIREFVSLYKQQPMLWDQKHPNYRNKSERADAYELLVNKCREYHLEADEDFVRMKIDSMRSTFRKEHRKVLASKEIYTSPDEIYKPSLWYYDLLLFTVGQENDNSSEDGNEVAQPQKTRGPGVVRLPFWSREYTAIMIDLYKKYPCLYDPSHSHNKNKRRRNEALGKITESLMSITGKTFFPQDVKKKIALIRGNFLREYRKIENCEQSGETYTPCLWYYELLRFLEEQYRKAATTNNLRRKIRSQRSSSDESGEEVDIKKESDFSMSWDDAVQNNRVGESDDIFDTIAKNMAHKLRDMTEQQRNIAERIVKDVMYYGLMEDLTLNSRLVLNRH